MPKANTLISRDSAMVKLSEKEKGQMRAAKAIVAQLKGGDAAGWRTFVESVNAADSIFSQTGDGVGKRYNGAKSHDFQHQIEAFADTVTRGNLPRASAPVQQAENANA